MLVGACVKMSVVNAFASFLAGRRSDLVDPNFPFVGQSGSFPETGFWEVGRPLQPKQVTLALMGHAPEAAAVAA